eukprot:CAMPEP_0201545024 /NCGR_PEP_ID=MMETSP0173_2-20130828/1607_1 /ASSEMBLY_ACC=CAM_ASM_000268 /TAXON_ID=218659 /ORGANISM="Vexillifera sp., Strain DIVA3 564/2" /LENGTH=166 /DNA_ID=CAMNT_0047953331 /DNA_START=249 /DNA_END=746 /DNA_ORIENTATION=-
MIKDTPLADKSLEQIAKQTKETLIKDEQDEHFEQIHFLACEVWNHAFLFSRLSSTKAPLPAPIVYQLDAHFGGLERFRFVASEMAEAIHGSGWVWLVDRDDNWELKCYWNGQSPLVDTVIPLVPIDCWEHAYYRDYGTNKSGYAADSISAVDWQCVLEAWKKNRQA